MLSDIQKQRHVPLPGTTNLRNLGGYETASGKHVKWGVVYRGDQLADVTPEEAAKVIVGELHVKNTYDLREDVEADAKMYTIPGVQRHPKPLAPKHFIEHRLSGKEFTPEITRALMNRQQKAFTRDYAATIGSLFKELIEQHPTSDNAAYIHCTAGKDRTGLVCYLLLRMLGVNTRDVYEDYLLTNQYFKEPADSTKFMGGLNMGPEARHIMWTVDAEFLQAVEDEIGEIGGFDVYTHEKMGLTDDDIAKLREYLLE